MFLRPPVPGSARVSIVAFGVAPKNDLSICSQLSPARANRKVRDSRKLSESPARETHALPNHRLEMLGLGGGLGRGLGVVWGLGVGIGLGVAVGLPEAVAVGVDVGVPVAVAVGVDVGVEVAVAVAVAVAVGVTIGVAVAVAVAVPVGVTTGVAVAVAVGVGVPPPGTRNA